MPRGTRTSTGRSARIVAALIELPEEGARFFLEVQLHPQARVLLLQIPNLLPRRRRQCPVRVDRGELGLVHPVPERPVIHSQFLGDLRDMPIRSEHTFHRVPSELGTEMPSLAAHAPSNPHLHETALRKSWVTPGRPAVS